MRKSKVPPVKTVRMELAALKPADYNPRKISPRAMEGLRNSLQRFGELGGIVWNERTRNLVGGHQRVKALLALGETHAEVRVVDLPVAEEKAANLALNHAGIGGEWDDALLSAVLEETRAALPTAFDELHFADLGLPDIPWSEVEPPSVASDAPAASGVTFCLDAEQRAIVEAALAAAGADRSTQGRAAALVEVCSAFGS